MVSGTVFGATSMASWGATVAQLISASKRDEDGKKNEKKGGGHESDAGGKEKGK